MSKYTTEVRFICEHLAGLDQSVGYPRVNEIIETARPLIFNFDYPIFDDEYKPVLETKILKHYYTREIGMETYSLWKLKLETKLNEIMPFYNSMYSSNLLNINPYLPIDIRKSSSRDIGEEGSETGTQTNNLTDTSTGNTRDSGTETTGRTSAIKNTRYDIYSDTPQGALTGVNSESYLTNARKITDDGTGTSITDLTTFGKIVNTSDTTTRTGTIGNIVSKEKTTTDAYLEQLSGRNGNINILEIAKELKSELLNVDMMVINELSDLFMLIW